MKDRPKITGIEVRQFEYQTKDVAPEPKLLIPFYQPGSVMMRRVNMLRIFTDAGVTGERLGGSASEYATLAAFLRSLIGRSAMDREAVYNDAKYALQPSVRMAVGQVDMALWDLAGKYYDAPVSELLGGYRTSLPTYASTYLADRQPGGLDCPEAFAEFAEQCLELGYLGFKTHPWPNTRVEEWIATNHAIARQVGGKMDLMVDAYRTLQTFGDALKLGWSCDEEHFFWWEDPFMDGGISAFAHRKLRQLVRTPLLQMEHVRGLESHVDFIVADGSDFVRGDVDFDGGITGVLKIAHAAEGFGLDIELHKAGPAQRHLMSAIRNSNYYEMALVHPRVPATSLPFYKCDYKDGLDAIDRNGCVSVPEGPGLGVTYDWDYINKHTTSVVTYD
ncbi:MAG: enolase C-terminal domain-like protein [Chloroflexota bacterium]